MTELIFRGNDHLCTPYGVFCFILNTNYEFNLGVWLFFIFYFFIFLLLFWCQYGSHFSAAQNLVAPGQGVSKGRNYACRIPLDSFCLRIYGVADFNWFESNAFISDPILIFMLRMNPSNPIIQFSLFRHPRGIRHMNSPHTELQSGPLLPFDR